MSSDSLSNSLARLQQALLEGKIDLATYTLLKSDLLAASQAGNASLEAARAEPSRPASAAPSPPAATVIPEPPPKTAAEAPPETATARRDEEREPWPYEIDLRKCSALALTHLREGLSHAKGEGLLAACQAFDAALQAQPQWSVALACRGEVLLARGDFDGAIRDLQRATSGALFSSARAWNALARAWFGKGNALFDAGRFDLAVDAFERANETRERVVRHAGDGEEIYFLEPAEYCGRLAMAQLKAGDTDGAASTIDKALREDPSQGVLYFMRALAYRVSGDTAAALDDLNEALSREPDNLLALGLRGELQLACGNAAAACEDFSAVCLQTPEAGEWRFQRARARLQLATQQISPAGALEAWRDFRAAEALGHGEAPPSEMVPQSLREFLHARQVELENRLQRRFSADARMLDQIPALRPFRQARLAAEQSGFETKRMADVVRQALEELASFESDVEAAQQANTAACANWWATAPELGAAATAAYAQSQIPPHPVLARRIQAQFELVKLQRDKAALTTGGNTWFLGDMLNSAQGWMIDQQIATLESTFAVLEREIGEALLTSGSESEVQAPATETILRKIAGHRDAVLAAREAESQAIERLNRQLRKLADQFGLAVPCGRKDVESLLSKHEDKLRGFAAELEQAWSTLPDVLLELPSADLPPDLQAELAELRQIREEFVWSSETCARSIEIEGQYKARNSSFFEQYAGHLKHCPDCGAKAAQFAAALKARPSWMSPQAARALAECHQMASETGVVKPAETTNKGFFGNLFGFFFNYHCPACDQRSGEKIGEEILDRRQEVGSEYEHGRSVQVVFNVYIFEYYLRCSDCGHEWTEISVQSRKA